ncbi:hypothetical protein N752_11740 [Desulforamulus aquiferis]|nr:nitrogenase component 1 [Desulforamulus aquiferis]RYD05027.1 hypothetical protein N752_11740 [Desulforamulus aquiferis]
MQLQQASDLNHEVQPAYIANLLGEFNNMSEVSSVQELLREFGIIAEYIPGDQARSAVYQRANINIFHMPMSEVITQKRFQTRFSRPYLTVSFFGPSETAGALRDIGLALGLDTNAVEKTYGRDCWE